jgi:uncharacterized membrane protein
VALISALLVLFTAKVLKNRADRVALTIVILLMVQFILGMLANLFQDIPIVEPWLVFHQFGPILLHTINATFLLIFSVILLVNASKARRYVWMSIIGCASVIVAFASGLMFVNAGQNDILSFTMSLGFLTAFIAYTYIAFRKS